jgi:hypothetical protein
MHGDSKFILMPVQIFFNVECKSQTDPKSSMSFHVPQAQQDTQARASMWPIRRSMFSFGDLIVLISILKASSSKIQVLGLELWWVLLVALALFAAYVHNNI